MISLKQSTSSSSNYSSYSLLSLKKIYFVSTTVCTLLFLLLLLNATLAFTVNPTTITPTTIATTNSDSCLSASSSSTNSDSSSATTTTNNNNNNNKMSTSKIPIWFQKEITITAPSRGCHLITSDIQKAISSSDDLSQIKIGLCNLFIQHTSASLTINENADPDVRRDLEVALNKIVPAAWNRDGTFRHTMEGDDDMPGHVKSSLMGPSLNVPIKNGKLALGTWQGIYLNEHRDQGGWGGGHARRIVITLQGTS